MKPDGEVEAESGKNRQRCPSIGFAVFVTKTLWTHHHPLSTVVKVVTAAVFFGT